MCYIRSLGSVCMCHSERTRHHRFRTNVWEARRHSVSSPLWAHQCISWPFDKSCMWSDEKQRVTRDAKRPREMHYLENVCIFRFSDVVGTVEEIQTHSLIIVLINKIDDGADPLHFAQQVARIWLCVVFHIKWYYLVHQRHQIINALSISLSCGVLLDDLIR